MMHVQGSRKIALNPGGSEGNLATCQLPIPISFEFAANVKQLTSLLEHFLFRSLSQSRTLFKIWTQEITKTLVPSKYYSPEMFLIS